jgi:hypothetical protein
MLLCNLYNTLDAVYFEKLNVRKVSINNYNILKINILC